MKLRHAAALALAGWYLMSPPFLPFEGRVKVDTDAPLSKWEVLGSDDTAADCNLDHVDMWERAKKEFNADPSWKGKTLLESATAAQCIASDDARLKGK
jgi:hypothetical protein